MKYLVSLTLDDRNIPTALIWQSRLWEVTDTPTELEMDYLFMTHPLRDLVGWRFQGTNAAGVTRVFDVGLTRGRWELLRSYD